MVNDATETAAASARTPSHNAWLAARCSKYPAIMLITTETAIPSLWPSCRSGPSARRIRFNSATGHPAQNYSRLYQSGQIYGALTKLFGSNVVNEIKPGMHLTSSDQTAICCKEGPTINLAGYTIGKGQSWPLRLWPHVWSIRDDLTMVAYGAMLRRTLEAAELTLDLFPGRLAPGLVQSGEHLVQRTERLALEADALGCRREAHGRLDRSHLSIVCLRGQHQTGAHELAVQPHRARAALPLLACALRAEQSQFVA